MKKNTRWLRTLQETSVISARITIPRDPQTYMENVEVPLFREKRERDMQMYVSHIRHLHKGRQDGKIRIFHKKMSSARYDVCKYITQKLFLLPTKFCLSSEYFEVLLSYCYFIFIRFYTSFVR